MYCVTVPQNLFWTTWAVSGLRLEHLQLWVYFPSEDLTIKTKEESYPQGEVSNGRTIFCSGDDQLVFTKLCLVSSLVLG